MKKKIIFVVSILVVIGVVFFILRNKETTPSLLSNATVCDYINNNFQNRCSNGICSLSETTENNWTVFYSCPGPVSFPMGQGYSLIVDKKSGKIEINGLTN